MKYNQLKAELFAAGCFPLRGGGKHEMWFSPITGKRFPGFQGDSSFNRALHQKEFRSQLNPESGPLAEARGFGPGFFTSSFKDFCLLIIKTRCKKPRFPERHQ